MNISHILVVGSGIMGSGIAYVSAVGGFETTLYDVAEESLEKAKLYHKEMLNKGVDRNIISVKEKKVALSNLKYSTDLKTSAEKANFVIEAVPEVLEIKKQVFKQLDEFTKSDVILATNTSTMSPTEIGSFTKRTRQSHCDAFL